MSYESHPEHEAQVEAHVSPIEILSKFDMELSRFGKALDGKKLRDPEIDGIWRDLVRIKSELYDALVAPSE